MQCMRSLFFLLLAACCLAFCYAEEQQHSQKNANDHDRSGDGALDLDDVVDQLTDDAVKAALQNHVAHKYRDGVFEHKKNAIEKIRDESPELAAKVVDAALRIEMDREDLKKRQINNSTSSSVVPVFSSSVLPVVSSSSLVVPVSTLPPSSSSVVSSTSSPTPSSSSTTPPPPPPSTSTHHPKPTITTTVTFGRTIVVTYTPPGHVSEIIYRTTTYPNGRMSTHTSYKIVTPTRANSKPTVPPHLQGDAVRTARYAGELAAVIGVAVGFAALL